MATGLSTTKEIRFPRTVWHGYCSMARYRSECMFFTSANIFICPEILHVAVVFAI